MSSNPTLEATTFSKALIQDEIRPGLSSWLASRFTDPEAGQRGQSISGEPGTWPPLVVTALPGGGRTLYPHVVVHEADDSGSRIDARHDLTQHDLAIEIAIHGTTTTQMFNLRGLVRGYVEANRGTLSDAGFAEIDLDGNAADWDPTSKTNTWSLTASGLVHTEPDA